MKFTDITTACKIMRATVTEDNLKKYLGYVSPNSYLEAMTYPDAQHWHKATIDEVQQCLDMGVFEFLGPDFNPKGKNIIDTRMVYILKIIKATGLIDKYKGRLVVRGFRQIPGTDYDETYSPATHLPVIRSFFVMCLFLGLRIHALDVKGAFLQSPITDYELYIKLPEGFTAFGGHKYAKLKKSIYGLKQAARDWHEHQEKFLLSQDFKKSTIDPCYYVYMRKDVTSIIYVHIDDYLVGCNNDKFYKDFLVAFSNYTCYKEDICDLGDPLNHMQIPPPPQSSPMVVCLADPMRDAQSLTNRCPSDRHYHHPDSSSRNRSYRCFRHVDCTGYLCHTLLAKAARCC